VKQSVTLRGVEADGPGEVVFGGVLLQPIIIALPAASIGSMPKPQMSIASTVSHLMQ